MNTIFLASATNQKFAYEQSAQLRERDLFISKFLSDLPCEDHCLEAFSLCVNNIDPPLINEEVSKAFCFAMHQGPEAVEKLLSHLSESFDFSTWSSEKWAHLISGTAELKTAIIGNYYVLSQPGGLRLPVFLPFDQINLEAYKKLIEFAEKYVDLYQAVSLAPGAESMRLIDVPVAQATLYKRQDLAAHLFSEKKACPSVNSYEYIWTAAQKIDYQSLVHLMSVLKEDYTSKLIRDGSMVFSNNEKILKFLVNKLSLEPSFDDLCYILSHGKVDALEFLISDFSLFSDQETMELIRISCSSSYDACFLAKFEKVLQKQDRQCIRKLMNTAAKSRCFNLIPYLGSYLKEPLTEAEVDEWVNILFEEKLEIALNDYEGDEFSYNPYKTVLERYSRFTHNSYIKPLKEALSGLEIAKN